MSTSRSSEPPTPLAATGELRIAAAQARPVWLRREATTAKAIELIAAAAEAGAELIVFPEAFLPGYPWWAPRSNGAVFEDEGQKLAYRYYLEAAVELGGPELARVASAAGDHGIWVMLGIAERGSATASGTIFCTLVTIDPQRGVVGAHRKLMPTYDERLVWGCGDGHGLRTHAINGMRVSGLNCWENLMPLARHTMYADGADVHIGVWPGSEQQARWMTQFIAYEGRVWSISVCGMYSLDDVPPDFPLADSLRAWTEPIPFNGGTAIARPGGEWMIEPVVGEERLVLATLDPGWVHKERLSFDATGHYARPDVFHVTVDRRRQDAVRFIDEP